MRFDSGTVGAEYKASGVILAGGNSSRMGTDKAELKLHGQALLERTVRVLTQVVNDMVIVGPPRPNLELDVRCICEPNPGQGPLPAMVTGLAAARYTRSLVVACDLPLMRPGLICHLLTLLRDGIQAAVPVIDGVPQPLLAVYQREAGKIMQSQLHHPARRDRSPTSALRRLRVQFVSEDECRHFDPQLDSFAQINTAAEWHSLLTRSEMEREPV